MQKKTSSTLRSNLYFLHLLWTICPSRVILNFIAVFLDFAMWTFSSVIFMQYLFGVSDGNRSFTDIVWFIWFAVALNMASRIFSSWYENCFIPKTDIQIHYQLNLMLFQKVQSIDLSCYETPEFYNTYTKAATEASERAKKVLDNCATMVSAILASSFVVITMCRITLWSLIFIIVPVIANMYFSKKHGKLLFDLNQENTPHRRRMDYVNRVVYFRKYAGELRLTNIFRVLKKIYISALDNTVAISRKYAFKLAFTEIMRYFLMFVAGFEGMWLCASILGVKGEITLGELIILLNAIVSVSWMINDVEESFANTFSNAFFIENLRFFFNYVPKIDESMGGKTPPVQVDTIEFKNVSFCYPGQEGYALQNINLTFKRGQRHALVGINGSGKSTLIKLMLRFYDPTEGTIFMNGTDIREYDIKQYRQQIGVAFQDFALFAATVLENVLLHEIKNTAEREIAISSLKNSDVYDKIETLQYKEDTILTKEFDNEGVELSGGERQKIAIARAFAKNSPVIILDEPSSALDPIAEYKMFETITQLCKGENKLSVVVSHRLSSAVVCEKIFVFENGKLLEQGTHADLLAANGTYAYMFHTQARNYQVEEGEFHA